MKLTAIQIAEINKYLSKDDLFYDDIRDEMTDHIATTLEEQMGKDDNFEKALNDYMNSHLKVKLLTAARHQEILRDKQNRQFILKQFITIRGILIFSMITGIAFLASSNVWSYRFMEAILMIMMLFIMFGHKWFSGKYPFFKRLVDISQFYYLLPFLLLTQIHRFTEETSYIVVFKIIALSIGLTGYYLTYRSISPLQKNRYV